MKIAVIGCGFVGGTVADFLEEHTAKDGVEVIRCDPFKYEDGIKHNDLRNLDGAIICINAPTDPSGQVDYFELKDVTEEVQRHNPGVEIMIKSTIPMFTQLGESPSDPGNWNEGWVFNPEFLREKTAKEDFLNQKHFIIGVAPHMITYDMSAEDNPHAKFWTNIFAPSLPNTEFIYTDRETASMVKYVHNAWLATKVAWFHELSGQMPGLSNYKEMTKILAKFENIGASHMDIPNAEGGLGFGGGCFPKDTKALDYLLPQHDLLRETLEVNENLKKNLKGGTNELVQRTSYDDYKKEVPNEPFVLFIGTSHTYGECDNIKVNPYTTHLEDILNIKVVSVGFSGANNMELLQLTNELNDIGMFNKHCKLVILEPRITENSHSISLDEVIGRDRLYDWLSTIENPKKWNKEHAVGKNDKAREIEEVFEEQWRGRPHLNRTSVSSLVNPGDEVVFGRTLIELISKNINYNRATNKKILQNDIINHFANGDRFLKDSKFLEKITQELSINIEAVQSSSQYNLAYRNSSVLEMHKDLTCIEAIRNTVINSNIPFRWMLIDNRLEELHYLQYMTHGITDIFKYMLFSTPLQALITGKRLSRHDDIPKDLVCKCGHFNEQGNKKLADELVGPAVKNLLNKLEEAE
jgi:UDP-glucose 6-dehydrogenase